MNSIGCGQKRKLRQQRHYDAVGWTLALIAGTLLGAGGEDGEWFKGEPETLPTRAGILT